MFYLQKLALWVEKNGKTTMRWQVIYYCPERWPLALILSRLDGRKYRIVKKEMRK